MCLARMQTIDEGGEGGVWSRAGREGEEGGGEGARSEQLRHRGRRKKCSDGSRNQNLQRVVFSRVYILWIYPGVGLYTLVSTVL